MNSTNRLYLDLSSYYDQFCSHVDYAEQCDFAFRVYKAFNDAQLKQYYDLACGTGQHLQHMAQHGFNVTGLDNSQDMLDQAQQRCPEASLVCCDLAQFENQQEFDLITCFLYSMHYSQPSSCFIETLKRAYSALVPGGIFLFDMVDKDGIKNDAGVVHQIQDGEDSLSFQSRWHYTGEGDKLDLHLSISLNQQTWDDHHTMTAVNISQVQNWMTEIGFELTILERNFSCFKEWDGNSANVMIIGKRIA